jgi:phenylalanyl-tRNA synthetase beta chain
VLEVNKHPDADRLNVCRVDIGDGSPKQIVCGAPNVAAGLKVPCALVGASLPGDFTIKLAKVRGIESSACCARPRNSVSPKTPPACSCCRPMRRWGESIRDYLDLDDRC